MLFPGVDKFKWRKRYNSTSRYLRRSTYSYVPTILAGSIFTWLQCSSVWVNVRNHFSKLNQKHLCHLLERYRSIISVANVQTNIFNFYLHINRVFCFSCKANWYYTSERCRKLLLLIMNRTILPCRITAGRVVTLSIESFGVVSKILLFF